MTAEIAEKYGNRLRVRVCGLLWHNQTLLMVNHKNLTAGNFWAPPGGGIAVGEPAEAALIREFREEANLDIRLNKFLFACEFIQQPLHALELFFEVSLVRGEPVLGHDPELSVTQQMLTEIRYMSLAEIRALPAQERHGIFNEATTIADLQKLSGFYRI
jgi:8-oxo-dGTP diphosphatase